MTDDAVRAPERRPRPQVLAATQTPKDKEWFQGTADAVRQYNWMLEDVKNRVVDNIIILSGDHLCAPRPFAQRLCQSPPASMFLHVSCIKLPGTANSDGHLRWTPAAAFHAAA